MDYDEEEEPSQVKPHESLSVPAMGGSEALGLNAIEAQPFKVM